MTITLIRTKPVLALCLAGMLGGCGTVRLQSFDRFSAQTTQAAHRSDRQDCARHTSSADYQECLKRTDEAYAQVKTAREKAAQTR